MDFHVLMAVLMTKRTTENNVQKKGAGKPFLDFALWMLVFTYYAADF